MKGLILAPQPFFSPRGTPFSVYYRTMVTTELGHEVDFLTYGQGQDVDLPGVRFIRVPGFKFLGRVKIGPSPLKLFFDLFMLLRTVTLLIRNRYDFVHAHEEAVFWAAFLKPLFGFRLIYDMHSSLPEQLDNFQFPGARFFVGIFARLEHFALDRADAVITICPALADQALALIHQPRKHFLIENSIFDPVRLKEESTPSSDSPAYTPPDNKRLIVYAGTLEAYQGIGILIRGFRAVAEEVPEAFLLIVGGSQAQVREYKALAEELGLADKIRFTGRVAPDRARAFAAQADVLVSPRSSGTNTPLKTYEQLASGIPLVATAIYSHTQVLTEEVAFLVEPTPEGMAQGMIEALDPDGTGQARAQAAIRLYEAEYAREAYTRKLTGLLESLE